MISYNEIFNDSDDVYQRALRNVNLTESVMPLFRGRIVENVDVYNKVHRLLNCPEMERAHKFLYDVDYDQLTEDTITKVNNLYDYAVKNGFVDDEGDAVEVNDEDQPIDNKTDVDPLNDTQPQNQAVVTEDNDEETIEEEPAEEPTDAPAQPAETPVEAPAETPAETPVAGGCVCLYTAMKNGKLHTGECPSDATDPEQAKYDVTNKLTQFGYTDINILAVEDGVTGGGSAQVTDYGQKAITNSTFNYDTKKPSDILITRDAGRDNIQQLAQPLAENTDNTEEIFEESSGDDKFLIKDGKGPDASGILACNAWLRQQGIKDVGIDLDFADDKWYLDATSNSGEDEEITTFDKDATVSYEDVLTALRGYMTDELGESKDDNEKDEAEEKEEKKEDKKEEPAKDEEPAEEEPAEKEPTEEEPSDEEPAEEEETVEEEPSDEEPADEEPSDEEPAEEPAEEEPAEEEPADDEDAEEKDDAKDDEKEDKKDDSKKGKELSKEEKLNLATEYIQKFKSLLVKNDYKSYKEIDIADRADFYKNLAKDWKGKPDPKEFMTDANIQKLETMTVSKKDK